MSQSNGFRLSPQQARLWSLLGASLSASSRARAVLDFVGPLDAARLERGLRTLVARHEVLRTSYRRLPGTGTAVQVIGDVPQKVLEVLDWRTGTVRNAEEWLEAMLSAEGSVEAPPAPFTLLSVEAERHALVVDLPALSMDELSLSLFSRHLDSAMQDAPGDAEPPPQYADLAEVFQTLLEAEESAEGRRFWKGRDLSCATGVSPPARNDAQPLPGAPVASAFTGTFKQETVRDLEQLASRIGVGVPDVFLAAWLLLVSRLSGRDEVCVAVHTDGRNFDGLTDAYGLFERWLPLRATPRPRMSFESFVREVARDRAEVEQWQDTFDPGADLPAAAPGEAAVPMSFSFESRPAPWTSRVGAALVSSMECRMRTDHAPLALSLGWDGLSAPTMTLRYDPSRYTEQEMSWLMERLMAPLHEAAHALPERALEALPWTMGPEASTLLGFYFESRRDYDTDGTLPERFEARIRETPDAVAVAFEDERLTFAELGERANRLAWHLGTRGVGPEVRVAVCLERSVEQFVVLLGILKAGGTFVPLDPTYPRERLAYVIQQSGAPLVITRSNLRGTVVPEGTHGFLCLDQDLEKLAAAPAHAPEVPLAPENAAYVIFTSGSTGRPKGVVIQHRSALNLAATLRDTVYEGRGPGLKVSVNAPLVFDASVKQWLQLLNGHSLHIVPEEVRPDAERMRSWVGRHGVDVLDCTPSLLVPMLARGLGQEPDFSPALVLVGGEAIDARTWDSLAARPATRFVNMYGPTECTVNASACPIADTRRPSIGKPLGNVRVYVMSPALMPVPIDVPGELYIGGAGVARGYEGRPDLTAERFLPDPYSPVPGARMYRTGDVGRYREDGRIEFHGRADFQVKVRGYRIELGEIESLMRSHPEVGEAVALVRGERLVAYFVPKRGPATSAAAELELVAQVRGFLREMVPEYMLPTALVPLPRLPLTRNGKVDRGALPDPATAPRETTPYEAPTSELEQRIAAIWQEALKVERVGLHGNFFDLGGHSLLMVQVHEKLSAAFGRRFSMVELFQHPTVASLAKYIAQQAAPDAGQDTKQQARDERARKQLQAMQQQALKTKAGRGKR
ncbi:non-ribosomal peptide synthetase [Pyxidicoccus xibeiensis]|uniref:non-ribosomal peptide synthetase n=1 Tax=Pyxidicoccus xibeiensis TaxID=2906759 RepID=UPI0020A700B5|nr:amino acid adenylation domain-containing protein [Pyxidicoccus xibeiensis]MCP3144579.1 amino acid adenylation domain-containing protein [Pyxidicoccus xibeiensis]